MGCLLVWVEDRLRFEVWTRRPRVGHFYFHFFGNKRMPDWRAHSHASRAGGTRSFDQVVTNHLLLWLLHGLSHVQSARYHNRIIPDPRYSMCRSQQAWARRNAMTPGFGLIGPPPDQEVATETRLQRTCVKTKLLFQGFDLPSKCLHRTARALAGGETPPSKKKEA